MIIEQISIGASRGKRQEMGRALASLMGPIQVQRGCLSCRLLRMWPNAGELRVEAHWANQNDLIRHLRSETYKDLLLLMELGKTPPVVAFYSVLEVQGLNLVKTARARF